MPLILEENSQNNMSINPFLATPETHVAVCNGVWDLGSFVMDKYPDKNGKAKIVPQVLVQWEIAEEIDLPGSENDKKKKVVQQRYPKSLAEEPKVSKLRAMIEGWIGLENLKDDKGVIDLEKIIGKPCLLNVSNYTDSTGRVKAGVTSVSKTIPGVTVFELDNNYKGVDIPYVQKVRESNLEKVKEYEEKWALEQKNNTKKAEEKVSKEETEPVSTVVPF